MKTKYFITCCPFNYKHKRKKKVVCVIHKNINSLQKISQKKFKKNKSKQKIVFDTFLLVKQGTCL